MAARHSPFGGGGGGAAPHGCISFRYKRRTGRVKAESLLYTVMASGAVGTAAPPASLAAAITAEALVALSIGPQGEEVSFGGSKLADRATASAAVISTAANTSTAPPLGAVSVSKKEVTPSTAGGMKMGLSEQASPPIVDFQLSAPRPLPRTPSPSPPPASSLTIIFLSSPPQEQAAKQLVRLPYEHQGQGIQYQTGDFRDYLPGPAGGHAGGQHPQDAPRSSGSGGDPAGAGRLGHILYVRDSEEEHDSDEDPDDDLDI